MREIHGAVKHLDLTLRTDIRPSASVSSVLHKREVLSFAELPQGMLMHYNRFGYTQKRLSTHYRRQAGEHSGPQQHRRLRYQPRIPMPFEFPDTHANIMINAGLYSEGAQSPGTPSSIRQYQEINKR